MANFAPPADIVPTRKITTVRGFGGFLELSRTREFGESGPTQVHRHMLEVEQWTLRHKFRKVELPLSGGLGAMTQRRVATSFTFGASLSWDVSSLPEMFDDANHFAGKAFLDDLFIGGSTGTNQLTVAVLFALGNTSQYNLIFPGADPAPRNAHYYCDSVILDEIVVVTSTEPKNVVKMQAKGSGSAPLRRYSGPVWKGAGGFDLSQDTQKHSEPI